MGDLIKAEWFKLSKSFGFKMLCLCNAASIFSTGLLFLAGAEATGIVTFVVGLTYVLHHAVIGYLFAAIFLCGEFSNRTYGLSLLCGCSRKKVFLSKIIIFLFGLIGLFLIYTGATTVVMSIGNGFGQADYPDVLLMLLCGILGYVAIGAIIILVTVITKKAFVTVGIGMGITYALLYIEANLKENMLPFIKYTCQYQIEQLQFWGGGFSPFLFLTVAIFTFVTALTVSSFIFEKIEL